jgi:putative transposase
MGRVGSCFDNAAESFFSTLEWELFGAKHFETKQAARREVARYLDWYNRIRRHSSCEMKSPIAYETILAASAAEKAPTEEAA